MVAKITTVHRGVKVEQWMLGIRLLLKVVILQMQYRTQNNPAFQTINIPLTKKIIFQANKMDTT
jgi:hypothetical protein